MNIKPFQCPQYVRSLDGNRLCLYRLGADGICPNQANHICVVSGQEVRSMNEIECDDIEHAIERMTS